mmetsp:Transcript_5851/g.12785  ORF Transcript_5851/g.12785 Transcript_5851/m.12785 type:complete len:213 (-) Transcript_5851:198-836(-)
MYLAWLASIAATSSRSRTARLCFLALAIRSRPALARPAVPMVASVGSRDSAVFISASSRSSSSPSSCTTCQSASSSPRAGSLRKEGWNTWGEGYSTGHARWAAHQPTTRNENSLVPYHTLPVRPTHAWSDWSVSVEPCVAKPPSPSSSLLSSSSSSLSLSLCPRGFLARFLVPAAALAARFGVLECRGAMAGAAEMVAALGTVVPALGLVEA